MHASRCSYAHHAPVVGLRKHVAPRHRKVDLWGIEVNRYLIRQSSRFPWQPGDASPHQSGSRNSKPGADQEDLNRGAPSRLPGEVWLPTAEVFQNLCRQAQ
ncbi:MAG: hypothetical protein JW384_02304 [Nitrosomonadaceae bacterium]|nr:hypothetical protein [Nitrosomonadaceae bacterium]